MCSDEMIARRLRRWTCAGVAAFLLGLISHAHFAGSGDPVHYMVIARSLALDGDLDLANDYADPGNLIADGNLAAEAHARPGRDGALRPVHDVGLPLLAAPWFGVAYAVAERFTDKIPERIRKRARLDRWIMLRQLVSIFVIALSCVLAALFFDVCLALTGAARLSFLAAVLFTLSPPVLSHAYVFFTEIPSALLALWAYWALRSTPSAAGRRAFGIGCATGFLLLLHVRNVGLALGLACLAAHRFRANRRQVAAFAAGFATLLALRTALNWHFWGTLFVTPHARPEPWAGLGAVAAEVGLRTLGLLLDQEHGLLPYAPCYLLAPAGWVWLRRRHPDVAAESLVLIGAYLVPVLLPVTNVHGWRGGWSPAARFLVPVAPFLGLALAFGIARAPRFVAAVILIAQACLNGYFWSDPKRLWNAGTGSALVGAFGEPWAVTLGLLVGLACLTLWLVRPGVLGPSSRSWSRG
jgi:hypothetical protein